MSEFDVLTIHSSEDTPEVIKICNDLKAIDIKPWLDVWELRPGFSWMSIVEEAFSSSELPIIVFIGGGKYFPWVDREIRYFLTKAARKQPIIPVLLQSTKNTPTFPPFLESRRYVDFRKDYDSAFRELVWGITGKRELSK